MIYNVTAIRKEDGAVFSRTLETKITDSEEVLDELCEFISTDQFDISVTSEILDMEDLAEAFQQEF